MTMQQQPAVNGTAQETVDTLDYILQWGLGVWDSLPVGLQAFILTVASVSLLMEWTKRALLADLPKAVRIRRLWAASLPLGLVLAATGWYLTGGAIETAYWAVIGLTAGTFAMGLHYVTVKKVLPLLGWLWARLMLAVRGHA